MKESIYLAQKYAKAFDACAKDLQEAKRNFISYQTALKNLAQIKDIVDNSAISFNVKEPLLKKVLGKDIGAGFICLLVFARRFNLAELIEQELLALLDKREGVLRAQVTTATSLNTQEQKQVQEVLANYFKKKLKLSFKEDKTILGGMVVKQEDLCIDGSILGQLEALEQALKR